MNNRRESPEENPISDSRDAVEKKPSISRRNFLRISAIGIGSMLAACQKIFLTPEPSKVQPTATIKPTFTPTSPVEITPTPQVYQSITLNLEYLMTEGAKIGSGDANLAPDPVLVASEQQKGTNPDNIDPIEFTKQAFQLVDIDFQQPLHVLKYAIAQGVRLGTVGGITYFQSGEEGNRAFAGLVIFRGILNDKANDEYHVQEGYPQGLVIRKGSGISIVGRGTDGNIVIVFEEYIDRLNGGSLEVPRMCLAVVTLNAFVGISQQLLPNVVFLLDEPETIRYAVSTKGLDYVAELNTIDDEMMDLIKASAGYLWKDTYTDPNSDEGVSLFPNPVVPYPPEDLLPEGITTENLILQPWEDQELLGDPGIARYYARDNENNVVFVSKYKRNENAWVWDTPGFQDVADLKRLEISAFLDPRWDSPDNPVFIKNFGSIAPGVFGFDWVHRDGLDKFNLGLAYGWISELQKTGQGIIGLPLVWHNNINLPEYFRLNTYSGSADEAIQIMVNHVSTLIRKFPEISEWGVLQEAVKEWRGHWEWEKSPWYRQNGGPTPNYIRKIYQAARNSNPSATLNYSDYWISQGGFKSDLVFNMIKDINGQSNDGRQLINKIVFEDQWDGDTPINKEALLLQIKRYRDIGLRVSIEIDCSFKAESSTKPEERTIKAIEFYKTIFAAAIESEWCEEIKIWNPTRENSYATRELGNDTYVPFSINEQSKMEPIRQVALH